MSKIFGSVGIGAAFVYTARPERKKAVLGLMIPVVLTAIICGITEPLEFTFLFVAPVLFLVHAILAATLSAVAFQLGVVGNFGGGLIDWITINWIPLFQNHGMVYVTQIVVGLCFTAIWFVVFSFLIKKFDYKTPGREDETEETKLFSKADFEEKHERISAGQKIPLNVQKAQDFLALLGGKDNILDVTNCATRLRLSVKDESLVQDASAFKAVGAHGLVSKNGAIQVIVGMSVAEVRDEFESLLDGVSEVY